MTTTGGSLYYKLTYGSVEGHEDIFGWYWEADNGTAFTSPAHKAWLALDAAVTEGSGEDARAFIALPEETLGISSLTPAPLLGGRGYRRKQSAWHLSKKHAPLPFLLYPNLKLLYISVNNVGW